MASRALRRGYLYGALQSSTPFLKSSSQTRMGLINLPGVRYYPGAGLKELKLRMGTIQSITKVTQSMKMIASAKLQKQQERLQRARVYFNSTQAYNNYKYPPLDRKDEFYLDKKAVKEAEDRGTEIIVAITSDRGLCGGVNSAVNKEVARLMKLKNDAWLVCVGDKATQALQREFAGRFLLTVSDISGNKPITYYECAALADVIMQQPWNKVTFIYNYFTSVMQSTLEYRDLPDLKAFLADETMHVPFLIGDYAPVARSAYEFAMAGFLFGAITESQTCEIGGRMAAMENATKNGNELVAVLLKAYNKQRQQLITTELVEIVSGANAVDASMKKKD